MKKLTPKEKRKLQAIRARHKARQEKAKKAMVHAGFWRRAGARILDWFALDRLLPGKLSGGHKKRKG